MDYRKKRYFALEHYGWNFYWDNPRKTYYFRDLIQTGKYHEWNIKEAGDPYSCFEHLRTSKWETIKTSIKRIKDCIGFVPNKVVSVNIDKAEEFIQFLEDNNFKYYEMKKYMFGQ